MRRLIPVVALLMLVACSSDAKEPVSAPSSAAPLTQESVNSALAQGVGSSPLDLDGTSFFAPCDAEWEEMSAPRAKPREEVLIDGDPSKLWAVHVPNEVVGAWTLSYLGAEAVIPDDPSKAEPEMQELRATANACPGDTGATSSGERRSYRIDPATDDIGADKGFTVRVIVSDDAQHVTEASAHVYVDHSGLLIHTEVHGVVKPGTADPSLGELTDRAVKIATGTIAAL